MYQLLHVQHAAYWICAHLLCHQVMLGLIRLRHTLRAATCTPRLTASNTVRKHFCLTSCTYHFQACCNYMWLYMWVHLVLLLGNRHTSSLCCCTYEMLHSLSVLTRTAALPLSSFWSPSLVYFLALPPYIIVQINTTVIVWPALRKGTTWDNQFSFFQSTRKFWICYMYFWHACKM